MNETSSGAADVQLRNRAAMRMSGLTLLSRLTGFARVIVVAAVLGTSYLGNVYQSSNAIPNILFELFAAGALQSVLVPIMVDAVDRHRREDAEHTAGVVLGAMGSILAAIVAAGMVAAPWIMGILVSGVDDPAVRDAQVELGTFLLWFFLPQIVFYGLNLVATAVLNARGSFALPVFAPTVNNVVVIATYLLFGAMRGSQPPSLELTLDEKLVLALGTTAGVVAFCLVPFLGLWRSGFRLVPRFEFRSPILRRLARDGSWAAGFLALSQVLLVVVLVLSNRVEGGVVIYQLAFVLFMLPNSLFAVPVFTTAFPTLTRNQRAGDWGAFAGEVGRATRSIAFLTIASAAALVALSEPLADLVARGNAADRAAEIGAAIAAFALGLPGYSMILFLTRVSYAYGDTPPPTLVNLGVAVLGTAAMWSMVAVASDSNVVTAIGLGFSVAQLIGALVLGLVVRSRLHREGVRVEDIVVPALRSVVSASVAAVLAWLAAEAVLSVLASGSDPLFGSALAVGVGSVVMVAVLLGVQWLLGGPRPMETVRSLGAGRTRAVS
ncbi:MAG: murein biosynthesis integral membrane protein MurJ [Microthrixaceae bacterium]